jgi:hypothetical protein
MALLLLGIIFIQCKFVLWDDSPPAIPNELSPKDSLAVREILDENGLNKTRVWDVITLQNSMVYAITFDSQFFNKLILSRAFNNLSSGVNLVILNCPIETLIVVDTIKIDMAFTIGYTKLRNIPENITFLQGKLWLYLDFNNIKNIPLEIISCNVNFIDVQYNELCSVSDTLNNWIIKNSRNSDWQTTQHCN